MELKNMRISRTMKALAISTFVGTGAAIALASPASAYVVCNRDGDCWHTDRRWGYPGVGYEWHPDDWYFHRAWAGDRYHWREYHDGRGYWRGGVWVTF